MAEKWHALSVEDVTRTLETDAERGLTSAEAAARHERLGFNELKERPPVSFWTRLMEQLKGFVVIILIVASVISAALGDFIEAAVIMAIVVLNAAIGVIVFFLPKERFSWKRYGTLALAVAFLFLPFAYSVLLAIEVEEAGGRAAI